MASIEFFFDCSSPWTYLAFEGIQPVAERHRARIIWRPFLVGGVFNTINPSVYASREQPVPVKVAWGAKDMADWARFVGVQIGSPPVFPVNSVKVMRGALFALTQDALVPYARACFEAYWRDLRDISQDDVIRDLVADVGLDSGAFFTAIGSQVIKDQLRANTDELMARGGFGSPTMFIDREDMYFGNDRLQLVDAALARMENAS